MSEENSQPSDRSRGAGERLHDVSKMPEALFQEAQGRWGENINVNPARENGQYTGPVISNNDYLAQRVGNESVVIHRRDQVDFTASEHLKKRDDSNRLNDVNLAIRYSGAKAIAHFHDPQRSAIEDMFRRIGKASEHAISDEKAREGFVTSLGEVKAHMVEQHREARNRQFENRTLKAAKQAQSKARESQEAER